MWHGISYFSLRHEKICFKVYVSCLSVDQPVNMCILVRYICKSDLLFDGWMDDLRFYVLFNSISVISGRWADDNERLCAMEPRLRLRRFRLERGSNSGPLDQ